jgi:preprotein translocase subunit SecG
MDLSDLTNMQWAIIITGVVLVIAVCVTVVVLQKRRTARLRAKFGASEYDRAMREGGGRRTAEARLEKRTDRVEAFHAAWERVQAHFVDGPSSAVHEADELLRDVMTARGYPVSDFEQRAADISVDHPQVTANYRSAHSIALRQLKGVATTEELRQAMIHYRTLFEELVAEPALQGTKRAL